MSTYSEAIAAVETGKQFAYRNVWPAPQAIANDAGTVDKWMETSQGPYEASPQDEAATDWILSPDNGDRPPRGA